MNKRVFQIDQECFIIYVEDLSSNKERFLRIGNSSFLKEFGENLTFVTLISKIYPGDPFHELEVFRPNVDRKIIGLKETTEKFLIFLKENNIDIKSVNIVYAEEESNLFKEVKSEEDFLKKIENDNRISKHSFASFYYNGNIRIFNKNEVIFDLRENIFRTLSEYNEIKQLSNYFLKFYKESYAKSGIIHSNKSLFIFSENNFACITDSSSWIKDAIRVGIDPVNIDLIYVTERTILDSLFLKSILNKESKVKLIHKEQVRWEKLLSPDNILSLNPYKKSVVHKLGNISLNFKENKIVISSNGFKLSLEDNDSFLDKGKIIKGKFSESNIKKEFELIIDDFKKDYLTLYSYNPIIFERFIDNNNYISKFWGNISEKIIESNSLKILSEDSEYNNDYVPEMINLDFYSKLFAETVRRLNCEGSKDIDDNIFNDYMEIIENFSGAEININKFIIEQILGYGVDEERVCIRDCFYNKEFVYFEDSVNPFLNFQKEAEKKEWQEKQDKYRKNYKKNIDNNKITGQIGTRFSEVINVKQFYIEERERLKRFIESVIIKEKQRESIENLKSGIRTNDMKSKKEGVDKTKKFGEEEISDKEFEGKKRSKLFYIAAIFFIALIIASLFFIPFLYKKYIKSDKIIAILDKNKENREDRYLKDENKIIKKSANFKFFMTILDLLNLTNIVAEKNGYHRIVSDFEKPYVQGKDPDWIYPGNILVMPDSSKVTVKKGDVMWTLCENFLINQINNHEIKIQDIVEKRKTRNISMEETKGELLKIKNESYSEMLRDFIDEILQLKDLDEIEKLLENP